MNIVIKNGCGINGCFMENTFLGVLTVIMCKSPSIKIGINCPKDHLIMDMFYE